MRPGYPLTPVKDEDPFKDPLYFVATILDPKFRFRWLPLMNLSQSIELKLKQSLLDLIVEECELNASKQMYHPSSLSSFPSGQATSNHGQTLPKKRKLFEYDDLQSNNSELSPSDELALYLEEQRRMASIESWKSSSLSFIECVVKREMSPNHCDPTRVPNQLGSLLRSMKPRENASS